jgi:hypothetical protein
LAFKTLNNDMPKTVVTNLELKEMPGNSVKANNLPGIAQPSDVILQSNQVLGFVGNGITGLSVGTNQVLANNGTLQGLTLETNQFLGNTGTGLAAITLSATGGLSLNTSVANRATIDGSYLLTLIKTLSSNMSAPYTSQTLVLSANSFSTTVINDGACVLGDLNLIPMGYGANDSNQNILVRLYDLAASQVGSVTIDTVPVAETVFDTYLNSVPPYSIFSIPEGGVTCNNGLIIAAYSWYSYTQRVARNANYNGAGAFGSPTNAQYKAVNPLKATVYYR